MINYKLISYNWEKKKKTDVEISYANERMSILIYFYDKIGIRNGKGEKKNKLPEILPLWWRRNSLSNHLLEICIIPSDNLSPMTFDKALE